MMISKKSLQLLRSPLLVIYNFESPLNEPFHLDLMESNVWFLNMGVTD